MAEVPTFKLVLVGDGGTGTKRATTTRFAFSLFCFFYFACVSACLLYTYLCARFVCKFGTDHHHHRDVVVGLFFLLQKRNETKSSRDDRQRVVQL